MLDPRSDRGASLRRAHLMFWPAAVLAVLAGLGLWALGVPDAPVFGVVVFVVALLAAALLAVMLVASQALTLTARRVPSEARAPRQWPFDAI
ncbi:MAG: hypothetical protein KAI24_19990 [Planctomycetes bacterium]|nr:hypothetical protein [Planctomycetota bacterium]